MNVKIAAFLTFALVFSISLPNQASAKQKISSRISIDEFLDLVRTQSPDLTVESSTIDAFKARASGVRIQPGMVGYMQMRGGGSTSNGLEVSQEIPFPTKLFQDKKTRRLEYETQKQMGAIKSVSLLAQARIAYVEFWAASARLAALKEKQSWLHHHTELYRTTTLSDNVAQVHLLGIESESDLLESDILSAEASLIEARNALNSFAPSLQDQEFSSIEPAVENQKTSEFENPLVTWKEKDLKAKQARVSLAKQSYLPDLFVRVRAYESTPMSQANQELMVGVTVPFLNFLLPRAEIKEASAERARANAELQK
ncbi:MAG: TolC family protein [Deltaproteobacteria bacterium]|nr:MAG: TolC family protein [Deltaproteobacteria bacterium]